MERVGRNQDTPSMEQVKAMRAYIRDNIIHLKELREKALSAKEEAWRKANERSNDPLNKDGTIRPNDKGRDALENLSKDTQHRVCAHGIASNLPTTDRNFPINALVEILATGQLKGDFTRLSGGYNQVVFTDAPFLLLSNKDEALAELDEKAGIQKLTGLRTVLVNGDYEGVVEDLRKAFPWVSFRTAQQITDDIFQKRNPGYRSYEDRIRDAIKKKTNQLDIGA